MRRTPGARVHARPGEDLPADEGAGEVLAVYLRPLEPADAAELADLLARNREFLRPFDPERPPAFFTEEGQADGIVGAEVDRAADRAYAFGIVEVSTDRLVGRIALSSVARGALNNANLGYWIGQEFNGRGYGTAAVGQMVRVGFGSELGLHRIQAAVMPWNVASVRVLVKNGFRLEGLALRYLLINGTWEDHQIYAVTREELPA